MGKVKGFCRMGKLDKTVQDMLDEGSWDFICKKKSGISEVYYYIGFYESEGKYQGNKAHGITQLGMVYAFVLEMCCRMLRMLVNRINKGAGGELFDEIIEESNEVRKIRKHKIQVGNTYNVGRARDTREECMGSIEEDINRLMAINKKKRGKKR